MKRTVRLEYGLLAGLLVLYAVLAITSLRRKSVTVDEFAHLPVGVNLLDSGDFRYASLGPPLINVLVALPFWIARPEAPPVATPYDQDDPYDFWLNGYPFMLRYRAVYPGIWNRVRLPSVVLVGLLGLLVHAWARSWVGERPDGARARALAGLLAATLVLFSPNVLAHARLATTDAGIAFFFALAIFAFQRYLARPGVARLVLAGVALGLAMLAKLTAVYLYPILPVLLWAGTRGRGWRPAACARALLTLFATSLLVVHAGYLFQGSLTTFGELEPESALLRSLREILPARWPLGLPESWVTAFDRQLADAAEGDDTYLFGEAYEGGRWYFFLALLAVKTPLPAMVLALLAIVAAVRSRFLRSFESLCLLLPCAVLLAAFSLLTEKQLGLRMILPVAPLFATWVALAIARAPVRVSPLRWASAASILLALWLVIEALRVWPHYIPYFNQAAGGPASGGRYAIDSNLDWGQDLIALREYVQEHSIGSIQLYYFGRVDPEVYGIDYVLPRQGPGPGFLAVSASLFGRSYPLLDHGAPFTAGPFEHTPELESRRVASIGHSIHVYDLRRR